MKVETQPIGEEEKGDDVEESKTSTPGEKEKEKEKEVEEVEEEYFTSRDGIKLYRHSWRVKDPCCVYVIVHGYADHGGRYAEFSQRLNEKNINVESYDQRAHGKSPGLAAYIPNLEKHVDDVEDFLTLIRSENPEKSLFLSGHSMGGELVALYGITRQSHSSQIQLTGAALLSPCLKIAESIPWILVKLAPVAGAILGSIPIATLEKTTLTRIPEAIEDFENDPLCYHGRIRARTGSQMNKGMGFIEKNPSKFMLPFILFHGTDDKLTSVEGSKAFYENASSKDKTLSLIDGGYHILHRDLCAEEFYTKLIDWILLKK